MAAPEFATCPDCDARRATYYDRGMQARYFRKHAHGLTDCPWSEHLVPVEDPEPYEWADWPDELYLGRVYLTTTIPIRRQLVADTRKDT